MILFFIFLAYQFQQAFSLILRLLTALILFVFTICLLNSFSAKEMDFMDQYQCLSLIFLTIFHFNIGLNRLHQCNLFRN